MSEQLIEVRRNTATLTPKDVAAAVGSAVSAISLTALIFTELAPLSGPLGFVVISYALFIGIYAAIVSLDDGLAVVRDRVAAVVIQSLALILLLALVFVVAYTFTRGVKPLQHSNFYHQDMQAAGPLEPLSVGGIFHALIGTLEQITIALAITIPLGLTCAVFLNEMPGGFSRFVRTIVEAMTALPSIVAGLFIYATLILILGFDKSGFAAALAISVMMMPIIIRAADVVLRLVPGGLKEASLALGCSQWRTVWHVVLPTSRSGLMTAIILGSARGIGETSPVLVTAGFTASLNSNPFHGPQISLPLAVFQFVRSPAKTMIQRGFGAAAVLLVVVLILFAIARLIGGRTPGNLSPRQAKRRAARSGADVERFTNRSLSIDLTQAGSS